jgi:hypothetical protein
MEPQKLILVFWLVVACPAAALLQDGPSGTQDHGNPPPATRYARETRKQLQQLVAPIALYPDSLVAQILAAATYPAQVVEAERWLQANPNLAPAQLAAGADNPPWDPSVKALVQFPSVLSNLDSNLSWTSALGDAYYNQQKDVMDTIQELRKEAKKAGTLNSTPQENVLEDGPDIAIDPVDPDVVYVPAYDPWDVYGEPIGPYPDWVSVPGIFWDGPGISFGPGIGIGPFLGYGWGWNDWGFDRRHHGMMFDRSPYFSRSYSFFDRNHFFLYTRMRFFVTS